MRRAVTLLLVAVLALSGCLGATGSDPVAPSGSAQPQDGAPGNRTAGDASPPPGDGSNATGDDGNTTPRRSSNGTGSGEYAPGWPAMDDARVRPGVGIVDASCTANFVFSSPDNRTLYIGTAAHCVENVELGEAVSIADGAARGILVYSSWRTMDRVNESSEGIRAYNDFALVRIPNAYRDQVHPAMRVYGGPTGLATPDTVAMGDKVLMYGNSAIREGADELDPHEGYVTGSSAWSTDMYLVTPAIPGDSGSPVVTDDGKALGVLIHLEVTPGPGSNDAVNLAPALAYLEEHTGLQVELKTWSMASSS